MPLAERRANVVWEGSLIEGKGTIVSVGSGALNDLPITWAARTENPDGKTSPEELIAAAHAACYSMEFSSQLKKAGSPADRLDVTAVCTLDRVDGKPTITGVDLRARGKVPGLDQAEFERIANSAKAGCPVSRALQNNLEIRLKATLEG